MYAEERKFDGEDRKETSIFIVNERCELICSQQTQLFRTGIVYFGKRNVCSE